MSTEPYFLFFTESCPLTLRHSWQGNCYGLMYDKMTRPEAQKVCELMGADLVWIQSPEEQQFIKETFADTTK